MSGIGCLALVLLLLLCLSAHLLNRFTYTFFFDGCVQCFFFEETKRTDDNVDGAVAGCSSSTFPSYC